MAGRGVAILVGIALLAIARMLDGNWLVTHFPPDYRPSYGRIDDGVQAVRVILVAAGLGTILSFRLVGLLVERAMTGAWTVPAVPIVVAIILALAAAELILRSSGWPSVLPGNMSREPARLSDPVLGWIPKPSHTGYLVTGGRRIGYVTDAFGYREPNENTAPDFARPTILLAGESVMGGFGLKWDETIAARLSSLTQTQTVDLSVGGYATDQSYMRLTSELRRFQKPVAVVMLFSPMLFRRNGEDGRPHLTSALALESAVDRSKLIEIARWAIPYRSVEETNRSIDTTRAILSSVVRMAKSRGASPIILVPQFVPENPAERHIRELVLGNIDLPVVYVALDQHWRLPHDWHPDDRASRVMAAAIVRQLQHPFEFGQIHQNSVPLHQTVMATTSSSAMGSVVANAMRSQ